jgi:predicted nucleic acid-binding protein
MSRWYLDSSAALKLVLEESESNALRTKLDVDQPDLISCWLLDTEMRRAVFSNPDITQEQVSVILDNVDMHEVPGSLFRAAGLLAGVHLRSLDALHLAAAMRTGADHLVTYDHRMADSARSLGLSVLAPA